jgi:uncharacterized protein Yka (UPF0111/DUF47 family)
LLENYYPDGVGVEMIIRHGSPYITNRTNLSLVLSRLTRFNYTINEQRDHNNDPRVNAKYTIGNIKKIENEVEHLYRLAIADLFTKAKDFKPLMAMLRRREVYRHVANMSDKADDAANVVGMVVMKLT